MPAAGISFATYELMKSLLLTENTSTGSKAGKGGLKSSNEKKLKSSRDKKKKKNKDKVEIINK